MTERNFSVHELLSDATARAVRYLDGLDARGVTPTPEALMHLTKLYGSLPEEPTDPAAVLALLDDTGSLATVATAGPRFFGFVVGGSLPAALAANWLAGAWDQLGSEYVTPPSVATLEKIALRWLLEIFGLPLGAGYRFSGR
jgi:glutamate/tyrosine decarboxylase-like PLP-dependent enzyme